MENDRLQQFQSEFIQNCCYRLDESLRMVTIALDKISEEQLWQKPNSSLNSIGNLILHLCGNMTQYGIASLKETEDLRERDKEFSIEGGYRKEELLTKLQVTVEDVKTTIAKCTNERLLQVTSVQGFQFSGVGNIIHLTEHFSYHTGQIAFWVKLLNDEALGFYANQDLNKKNE